MKVQCKNLSFGNFFFLVKIDFINQLQKLFRSPAETTLEPSSCVKCIQYDIELQRSNMKIKTLESEVQALKMKIQHLQNPKKSALKTIVNVPRNSVQVKKTSEQSTYEKCLLCYKQLSNHEIDQHLCLEHRKFIQCPYCLMAFMTTNDLLNHMGAHKVALATDKKQKFYKCEKCYITFSMKILLECHRMAHVKGNDATGIRINHNFESLAIIKPEKTDKSNNLRNIILPSSTRSGPSAAPAPAYGNLVSNLKNLIQKSE